MKIGYARVSTADQHLDLQIRALEAYGCERIFTDTISGAKTDRPELAKALDILRIDDVFVCWRMDRLSRSLKDLIEHVEMFEKRGVHFVSLQENLDTTTPTGKLTFHIFGALAEFERGLIRERTNAGLAAAKALGRVGGRPSALTEAQVKQIKVLLAAGTPRQEIVKTFGISLPTTYRYVPASDT